MLYLIFPIVLVLLKKKKKEKANVLVLTRHHAPDIQGSREFSFPHLKRKRKTDNSSPENKQYLIK